MEDTNNSLTDSVKPETSVTESQTASTEAATNADKPSSEPGTSTGNGDEQPRSRANDRIRQLVEDRKQALAKLAEAEEQASFFKRQAEALKPKPAGREQDHPDQASYLTAKMREAMQEAQQAAAMQSAQQAEALAHSSRERAYQTRVEEFRDRAPDYDQVVGNPNLSISPVMADAIKESDNGAAVAYFLGKNPTEAARIASLSLVAQAREIGRLEAKVTVPTPRTTQAPPPVKTASGGTGTAAFDAENSSPKEFEAEFMRRLYPNG